MEGTFGPSEGGDASGQRRAEGVDGVFARVAQADDLRKVLLHNAHTSVTIVKGVHNLLPLRQRKMQLFASINKEISNLKNEVETLKKQMPVQDITEARRVTGFEEKDDVHIQRIEQALDIIEQRLNKL